MKKIIAATLVALLFLTAYVYAEDRRADVNDTLTEMKELVNLSAFQADNVKPILEINRGRRLRLMQHLKDQGVADEAVIRSKMDKLREDEYRELRQELDPDQMERWIARQKYEDTYYPDWSDHAVTRKERLR